MPRYNKILSTLVQALPLSPSRRFARSLSVETRDDLVRLGSDYGGHVAPEGLLGEDSVCYSAGVGDDISFDLALIERYGCRVDAFDPTPTARDFLQQQALPDELHFHPCGIWSEDTEMEFWDHPGDTGAQARNYSATNLYGGRPQLRAPVKSLRSIMQTLGDQRIDLLKIDIEGSEYEVIRSIVEDRIPVNAIAIEFHKDPSTRSMRNAVINLRRARLFPQHVDGYEVTFVRSPLLP